MSLAAENTVLTTMKVPRLYRLGNRRLARAHRALQQRPQVAQALAAALSRGAAALQSHLGHSVAAQGRVLENVFTLGRHLSHDAVFVLVELGALDATAVVEIERPVLHALIDRLSGSAPRVSPSSRLTRIEECAVGFLSLVLLQALRSEPLFENAFAARIGRVNLSRAEVLALVDGVAPHLGVHVSLTSGEVSGVARVFVPSRALMTALQPLPQQVPSSLPPELLGAELSLRPILGRSTLDPVVVSGLRPGDVVLFDDLRLSSGALFGVARLLTTTFELLGAVDEEGFVLTQAVSRTHPQEVPMSSVSAEDQTVTLPVEVEVELTRLRLTLGQLAGIRPGALLPLRIDASDPVTLRIGNRAIALAELVDIEGEVGARITSLLS